MVINMKIFLNVYVLFYVLNLIYCGDENRKFSQTVEVFMEKDIGLSTKCTKTLQLLAKRLNETSIHDKDIWALEMLDATSKIPAGLLTYNFGEMGNFMECINIASKRDNILGKYCLCNVQINDSAIHNDSIYVQNNMFLESILSRVAGGIPMVGNPTWAICLPSNCSDKDILRIVNEKDTMGLSIDSLSCQTADDVYPSLNGDAIIGISILSAWLSLILTSTLIDLYCIYTLKDRVRPIFVSFSIYTNGLKLFQIPERSSNLSCLDGIKVISMLWIVTLHTYTIYTSGPVFNSIDVVNFANSIASMFFLNGDLACDTFLIVGGILVTYVFFKAGTDGKLTITGILEHYIHRYIRLTPALAGLVLVSATLLRYMGSGPKWNYIVTAFEGNCKSYWWSTLLYIQNEVNVSTMCVGQSWYLNVDMQLFFLSPLIFWMLKKYSKTGISILILATLSSMCLSFSRAYHEEMSGIRTVNYRRSSSSSYMFDYYLKTETRAAPWLLGTILGYLLTKKEVVHFKLTKKYLVPLWVLSLSVIVICTIGGHATLRGPDYHRIENAVYISLVRPSFSIAIGWIIWACASKHGGIVNGFLSMRFFQFMNKFIYSMYLLHVTSLYIIVFSTKKSVYFSVFNVSNWFWAIFMSMFGLSVFWILIFESPMLALEKIIFSRN